jgi:hypothetical protein
MYTQPIDIVPLWGLFAFVTGLLGLVMEVGYRTGKWRHTHIPGERDQPVGAMVASTLGLVALVLGFSFSLAASRFDARRIAVLDEANAIGTTYLRASLLPPMVRDEVSGLLREYVDVRIAGVHNREPAQAIARSQELQNRMWAAASEAARQTPDSILAGIFLQSLNEMIDLHAKRVFVGLRSRIPVVIWLGVIGLACLGSGSVGYQAGLSATRRSPVMLGLVLAFSVVLLLIADLDRGQEGLLRVGQQAMVDVQNSMQAGR